MVDRMFFNGRTEEGRIGHMVRLLLSNPTITTTTTAVIIIVIIIIVIIIISSSRWRTRPDGRSESELLGARLNRTRPVSIPLGAGAAYVLLDG
jgi:hypothetical protein